MRILLIENETGAAAHVAQELHAAGYDVARCQAAGDENDDCVVFRNLGQCPLRVAPIDAAVDIRNRFEPATAREQGASCAARRGIPLIVAGPADQSVFPWSEAAAVCTDPEIIEACDAVLSPVNAGIARAVERVVRQTLQAGGADGTASVSVTEGTDDAAVFVSLPAGLTPEVASDVARAVRLAVAGRRDFAERPVVVVGQTD